MKTVTVLNFLMRCLPPFWITVGKHSPAVDDFLLDCMEKQEYFRPGFCTHTVRGREIWTRNYPYAYGGLYRNGKQNRCGAFVAWKLKRYLKNQEEMIRRQQLFGDEPNAMELPTRSRFKGR